MADDGDVLALLDRDRDVAQHLGFLGAASKRLVDVIDLQIGHGRGSPQFDAVPRVTIVAITATTRSSRKPTAADVGQRHHDVGDARGVPRVPDEEADADAAGKHLGRNDGKPGETDADP